MTLRWDERPLLEAPVLVAAFAGWNDAGDAATDALRWLAATFSATQFATVEPDDYVDFQTQRPAVELVDGVVRDVVWPRTRVLAARPADGGRDLVLVLGAEPNFQWRGYCDDIVALCREVGCDTAVTLGALLADAPHSRPVPVTGTATDDETISRLGLVRSGYEGPTGIVGVLHDACRRAALPSASLWASVPHYVAAPPSPKAMHALLERVRSLLTIELDLSRLDVTRQAWEERVDEIVEADPDTASYVRELERNHDRGEVSDAPEHPEAPDLPAPSSTSGDELAAELERFLRSADRPDDREDPEAG